MCGRDSGFFTWAEVAEFSKPLDLLLPSREPVPNYNRAPTQPAWVLHPHQGAIIARELKWGLIPAWANDAKSSAHTINARIETAREKPSFRASWSSKRCLVPSSGYFEWQMRAGQKQPFFIRARCSPILMYAGLWAHNATLNVDSYCVLTRPAFPEIAHLHDRSPVLLNNSLLRDWLYGNPDELDEILANAAAPLLDFYPVGRDVGNIRNNHAALIEPIALAQNDPHQSTI